VSRREDFFRIEEAETITPSVQTDANRLSGKQINTHA
jgi:hypothetical protein